MNYGGIEPAEDEEEYYDVSHSDEERARETGQNDADFNRNDEREELEDNEDDDAEHYRVRDEFDEEEEEDMYQEEAEGDNFPDDIQNVDYEVYDPDQDDDFPEYVNEANKKLNENIKVERRAIREIDIKIEDLSERLKIMREHYKNINQELKNTQTLIDAKGKETETERHLSMVAERQIGRVAKDLKKCDNEGITLQDRLNDTQQQIFKGNEILDKLKLQINFNQEEMEQWALAAKQKEEDNLTLEKYKRHDDARIKELSLALEKLTIEKNRIDNELEKEVTQTQAFQIEIDKTAEEFKKQHQDRHRIYVQWDEAIQSIKRKHEAALRAGEMMAKIKVEQKGNQDHLTDRIALLDRHKQETKNIQETIRRVEVEISGKKDENKRWQDDEIKKNAEVKILQNRLSAYSSELAHKRRQIQLLEKEILNRKKRLTNAEGKFNAQSQILSNERNQDKTLKEMNDDAVEDFKNAQNLLNQKEKEIRGMKDVYFKSQQKLFKLRETEANLYSEIQGTLAALRNLKSHISKLNQELTRQQELLYNAEYQIQLLERKVARANGERTNKEAKDIKEATDAENLNKEHAERNLEKVSKALKQLEDEKRNLERKIKSIEEDREKAIIRLEKLTLENDMTSQELKKITKQKEETMVQHDIMKLEIKKIQDRLQNAQEQVLSLENKKNQLELAMSERENEISVHKAALLAQFKAAEKERHKTAVELAERETKVKNLKIKYESLIQKKQGSEASDINEHSQAYYIIKAAQEKEELQRKKDELTAKNNKSEKELHSLINTLAHLDTRNSNYRDHFMNKGATKDDVVLQNNLEEQCKIASDNLMKKRKDFDKIKRAIDEQSQVFNEIQNRVFSLF